MRKLSDDEVKDELTWLDQSIERLQTRKHELVMEQLTRAKRAAKVAQ